MNDRTKLNIAMTLLIITIGAQTFISVRYFVKHDPVGGFVALASTIVWSMAAWQIHLHVKKKRGH